MALAAIRYYRFNEHRGISGDEGPGRMSEPDEIVEAAAQLLERAQDLLGRRVLVTAGGTQEPIDPVRFIGNRSSGLMGIEIARAAPLHLHQLRTGPEPRDRLAGRASGYPGLGFGSSLR